MTRAGPHPSEIGRPGTDGPRERLNRGGVGALSDLELIAVIIGHGTRHRGVLAVSADILDVAGGLRGLARLDRGALAGRPGVGAAQASRLQAAVELGRRTLLADVPERPRFLTPRDAARYLLPQFGAHPVERVGVLLLDTRYRLMGTRILSVGGLDTSLVHPREVFREALLARAAAVIVFHNHPSGDPSPSPEDHQVTVRLRHAGTIMGVDLADHLILADGRYYSMKESRCC